MNILDTRKEIRKHRGGIEGQKKRWRARRRGEYVESPTYQIYGKQYVDKKEAQRQYRKQNKGRWKAFGGYLAQLLTGYPGNKKELVVELGIHPSLLSHYLAGNRRPIEQFLTRLSEKFDVPYQSLESLVI